MKHDNQKLIAAAAVVIVLCLLFSYVHLGTGDDGDPAGGDLSGEVYIIHTNDSHGYYDEYLGFSAVAALKADYESLGATVILLDAGDAFQGTAITMLTHGGSTVDVMNAVGYDAMCPGNHEFDYGLDTYLGHTESLEFGTICANMVWNDTGELVFDPYTIIERDGVSVGVFGLSTPDTPGLVMEGYLDDVTFTDPVVAAEAMVSELTDIGVDWIVCLGHLGVDRSSSITSDVVCAQVDGIDVFIDGHSHTVMEGGVVADGSIQLEESDTLIASTGCYIQNIGVVHLTAEGGPEAVLVSDYTGSDPEVDEVVSEARAELEGILAQEVGYSEIEIHGERTEARLGEVLIGDFVTDTLIEVTGADIAVINGGAIRGSIGPGTVTANDVYTALPFENFIQTKRVTGQMIWDLMQASVSYIPAADGSYLQVSGMVVTYDSSRESGDRLISITLSDGTPLDLDATYLLASNDYVMAGGEGFEALEGAELEGTFGLVSDAVFERLGELGTVTADDIVEGRLIDLADTE